MNYFLVLLHINLGVFLLAYQWSFRRSTAFTHNRIYLLVALVWSIIIPWLPLHFISINSDFNTLTYLLEPLVINGSNGPLQSLTPAYSWSWSSILLTIWFLGAIGQTARLLAGAYYLVQLNLTHPAYKKAGFSILHDKKIKTPFSFFSTIYLPEHTTEETSHFKIIVQHEMVHIRQRHSLDILLIHLLKIPLWWSPLIYLLEDYLREVHEFKADAEAMSLTKTTPEEYGRILVKYASSSKTNTIVNTFNQSPIKSRIMMLFQNQSPRSFRKYWMFTPIIVLVLTAVQGCVNSIHSGVDSEVRKPYKTYNITTRDTVISFDASTYEETESIETNKINDIYKNPDSRPVLLDRFGTPLTDAETTTKLIQYLFKHITYDKQAKDKGIEGMVIAKFIVDKKGKVPYVTILRSPSPLLSQSVLDVLYALQTTNSQLFWSPATVEGKPVNAEFILPVKFKLNN